MKTPTPLSLRVLIVDDEPAMRDAYRQILLGAKAPIVNAAKSELRAKLFATEPVVKAPSSDPTFELTVCAEAMTAVEAVRLSIEQARPYMCVFLDMRMPPGNDGAWAAEKIRALDAEIEIIVCSAFSDVEPGALAQRAGPPDKLFYLQKPFHPFEVLQTARALGQKWHTARRLRRLAYVDSVTGIANQAWFKETLDLQIRQAEAKGEPLVVLSLDVNAFQRINDTLGHAAGDDMLRSIAQLLKRTLLSNKSVSSTPVLARLSGNEFGLTISGPAAIEQAVNLSQLISAALLEPIPVRTRAILMSVCIGTACYPADGLDADTLRRNAGLALKAAKRRGPGQLHEYEPQMNIAAKRALALEEQLRGALGRKEFYLVYQPQVDLASGEVVGTEALLRWRNPELGAVAPLEFIGVAEALGLMCDLGEWVLRTACVQARAWETSGVFTGIMCVNVSCAQLIHGEFPAVVAAVLRDTGLEASMLELEVTESLAMSDEAGSDKAFSQLKALGVKLALDDFGTGYSSFSRLQQLPIDRVKIDRSFISGIHTRASDRMMLAAIVKMVQVLGLDVIAEGVENAQQLQRLHQTGCTQGQGYLLSKPLEAADFEALVARAALVQANERTARIKALVA